MDFVRQLIESGEPVKNFREALIEASRSFAPGSMANLLYQSKRWADEFYTDKFIYEFQLYSDRPTTCLKLRKMHIEFAGAKEDLTFNSPSDINQLKQYNSVTFDKLYKLEMFFELVPELKHLVQMSQFNPNAESFKEQKEVILSLEDGTHVTGTFVPKVYSGGIIVSCNLFRHDADPQIISRVYINDPPINHMGSDGGLVL